MIQSQGKEKRIERVKTQPHTNTKLKPKIKSHDTALLTLPPPPPPDQ